MAGVRGSHGLLHGCNMVVTWVLGYKLLPAQQALIIDVDYLSEDKHRPTAVTKQNRKGKGETLALPSGTTCDTSRFQLLNHGL